LAHTRLHKGLLCFQCQLCSPCRIVSFPLTDFEIEPIKSHGEETDKKRWSFRRSIDARQRHRSDLLNSSAGGTHIVPSNKTHTSQLTVLAPSRRPFPPRQRRRSHRFIKKPDSQDTVPSLESAQYEDLLSFFSIDSHDICLPEDEEDAYTPELQEEVRTWLDDELDMAFSELVLEMQ
jgi:hypothetical protein